MALLLNITKLAVGYDGAPVVNDTDLALEAGTITAIIGPNGSGKTTFLRAIMGELRPQRGRIEFAGVNVTGISAVKRADIGLTLVPEGRRVFAGLTVRENLEVASTQTRRRRQEDIDRIRSLFPPIADRMNVRAWQLSGGQQQMLSLGRALMAHPKLILMDEPTLGLAPNIVDEIWRRLETVVDDGATVLLAEQNAARLRGLETVNYQLEKGRLSPANSG